MAPMALRGQPGVKPIDCSHKPRSIISRGRLLCRATAAPKVDTMELGRSGLQVPVIGVGAWSWGDRSGYWGYGKEYGKEESRAAYKAIVDAGIDFIDTAEVYGFGMSESFLGEFMKDSGTSPIIATKFAPQPWRQTPESLVSACKASLARLQLPTVDLYMQHWPGFVFNAFSNDAHLEGLIRVKEAGLAKAVGVSNFNAGRLRKAAATLQARGVALASNQVQYSLLYRTPETNGVLDVCREYGITLVAYSPLCQGLLTGKYTADGPKPSGPRAAIFNGSRIREIQPLLQVMREVGAAHGGKSPAQVALNWCICKGTLPIPGVKNERQLAEVAGAVGWRLSEAEVAELDKVSSSIPTGLGAPFENW